MRDTFKILLTDPFKHLRVVEVIQAPGHSANERLVIVHLGDRLWPIRTSDRLLVTEPGTLTCVSERHIFLRRWKHYRLELPGFCQNLMHPVQNDTGMTIQPNDPPAPQS